MAIPALTVGLLFAAQASAQSVDQVERGTKVFSGACAACHGAALGGGPAAPPLTGPEFAFTWAGKSAAELYDYVRTQMPPGQAGSLADSAYLDVVAVILKANGVSGGELTGGAGLGAVTVPRP